MFTGLVEKTAKLANREINGDAGKLHISISSPFESLKKGESIAVNGACLTLEQFSDELLIFHVLSETFKKTNLGQLPINSTVNLERAMSLGDRFGGHIVSGHIDTVSHVKMWEPIGDDWELHIFIPDHLKPYLIDKGSITIDGVSLTIVNITTDSLSVHLIPTTLEETALFNRPEGSPVNLEADLIGKYVQKQLAVYANNNGNIESENITIDTLLEAGW